MSPSTRKTSSAGSTSTSQQRSSRVCCQRRGPWASRDGYRHRSSSSTELPGARVLGQHGNGSTPKPWKGRALLLGQDALPRLHIGFLNPRHYAIRVLPHCSVYSLIELQRYVGNNAEVAHPFSFRMNANPKVPSHFIMLINNALADSL